MTANTDGDKDAERKKRRDDFLRVFESIPGTIAEKTAKVCSILHYKPHTIYVMRCRKTAWKVIPQAKLDILVRELAREASQPGVPA